MAVVKHRNEVDDGGIIPLVGGSNITSVLEMEEEESDENCSLFSHVEESKLLTLLITSEGSHGSPTILSWEVQAILLSPVSNDVRFSGIGETMDRWMKE